MFAFAEMVFVSCDIPGESIFTEARCLDITSPAMEIGFILTFSYLSMDLISSKIIWPKWHEYREVFLHHMIGVLGIIASLEIGRIVGSIAMSIILTEISTLFLNVMHIMRLLNLTERYPRSFAVNSGLLVSSFFLSRVIFYGYIMFAIVIPTIANYDYEAAAAEIGWGRVRLAQSLVSFFVLLYLLNLFWMYKLVRGWFKMR